MQDAKSPGGIRGARGVCLDLDGVLYVEGVVIPGAVDAVARLAASGIPFRYLTNTTSRSRASLAARLAGLGFPVREDAIFSAPAAAAAMLRSAGVRRLSALVAPDPLAEFSEFEIGDGAPEAVVVGDLADAWTPAILNRAMNQVLAGARLIALCKSRNWRRASGLVMDAGPYVAALEFATGAVAEVAGKPSPRFFQAALESMRVPAGEAVMVGDDPESDIAAAQSVGMRGALVLSGKVRAGGAFESSSRPDAVFPSVVEAVAEILDSA